MKLLNKIISLFLTLLLCFSLLSVYAETTAIPTETKAAEAEELVQAQPDTVVATVNGIEIKGDKVNEMFDQLFDQYSRYGIDLSDVKIQKELYQVAIDSSIQKEVLLQKSAELGLNKLSDDDRKSLEEKSKMQYMAALNQVMKEAGLKDDSTEEEKLAFEADAKKTLIDYGYTEELILENEILNSTFQKISEYFTKDITVNDEEIETKYKELVEKDKASFKNNIVAYENAFASGSNVWFVPDGYKGIKHILLNIDEALLNKYKDLNARFEELSKEHADGAEGEKVGDKEPVTQEEIDNLKKEIIASVQTTIDEINKKLAEGISFDELVASYGMDPGMKQEPYKTTGYNVHNDSIIYDPSFTAAASTLTKIGDVSAPVVGMYGLHILYYSKDIPSGAVELNDKNKEIIKGMLLSEKQNQAITDGIEKWKSECDIVISK